LEIKLIKLETQVRQNNKYCNCMCVTRKQVKERTESLKNLTNVFRSRFATPNKWTACKQTMDIYCSTLQVAWSASHCQSRPSSVSGTNSL